MPRHRSDRGGSCWCVPPHTRPRRFRSCSAPRRQRSGSNRRSRASRLKAPARKASRNSGSPAGRTLPPSDSILSASFSSMPARWPGVVKAQLGKARVAAPTARSICSREADGILAMSSPVAGLRTSSGSPVPTTNSPSMYSFVSTAAPPLIWSALCQMKTLDEWDKFSMSSALPSLTSGQRPHGVLNPVLLRPPAPSAPRPGRRASSAVPTSGRRRPCRHRPPGPGR